MDKWKACGEEITHPLCYLYQVCMCTLYSVPTVYRKKVKRQKILSREFISTGLEPYFIFLVIGSA